ncbi:Alpha/Beta hydrolase protein [Aspergillus unguis]
MDSTTFELPSGRQTVVYSSIDNHEVRLDFYLPPTPTGPLPAIIYYHGGGMTAGSRCEYPWPEWLYKHCQKKNYMFISADYRLCHPTNTLDQIEDAKALFSYLASDTFAAQLPANCSIDTARIAVSGFSAGAYSARAACLYANPKPAALLSVYGLGGNLLLDHWTRLFDLSTVPALLADQTVVSEGSMKRFPLTVHWELQGTMLDGLFQCPGLGKRLDGLKYEKRFEAVPDELKPGVLDHFVDAEYPPSVFVHGEKDDVVSPEESEHHYKQLQELGVKSRLLVVKDGPHGLEAFGQTPKSQIYKDTMAAYEEALAFVDETLGV